MAKTILCFGSEVEGDETPFEICDAIGRSKGGLKFVKCDSPVDMMNYIDKDEIIILDSVRGLDKPKLFSTMEDFRKVESVTAHDLDLGTFLKVLDEMKRLNDVRIIGIPFGAKKSKIVDDVKRILSSQV
jgi:Ni,Fe-hydrogenase maturation factor